MKLKLLENYFNVLFDGVKFKIMWYLKVKTCAIKEISWVAHIILLLSLANISDRHICICLHWQTYKFGLYCVNLNNWKILRHLLLSIILDINL